MKETTKEKIRRDSRERYYFSKERGMCPRCHKEEVEPGKHLCKRCLLDHASYQLVRFHQLKEQGQCVKCGKPITHGTRCAECKQKEHKTAHATYHERIAQGLCPRCGGKRSDTTRIRCEKCREKTRINELRRKAA